MKTPTIASEHILASHKRLMWTSGVQMTYFMKLFKGAERHRAVVNFISTAQVFWVHPIPQQSDRHLDDYRLYLSRWSLSSWSRRATSHVQYYAISGTRQASHTYTYAQLIHKRHGKDRRVAMWREAQNQKSPSAQTYPLARLDANW